jgi:hypothetical protein
MKEEITELRIDHVFSLTDLIDSCMESSLWGMDEKPSVWYSQWKETIVIEELLQRRRVI